MEVVVTWNELWTRDRTLHPFEVELAKNTAHWQPENRPVGWDFHTVLRGINPDDICVRPLVVRVVDGWMSSDPSM